MDVFESCDYDLLDVMDPWGIMPFTVNDAVSEVADSEYRGDNSIDRDTE
jgi:hypothetical protein